MTTIIDGQITILLGPNSNNNQQLSFSNTLLPSAYTNFYLRGFNVVGAAYPATIHLFITSNKLQLAHNDATNNINVPGGTRVSNYGNGVILPLSGTNTCYEYNTPIKLRATEFPRWFDLQVKDQNGDPATFTALALYFELK